MNSPSSFQLDLLATATRRSLSPEIGMLGVVLDQDGFLQFLSEEWLYPARPTWLMLGTKEACAERSPHDTPVAIWFDVQLLPNATVMAWKGDSWRETTSRHLQQDDVMVAWNGPLPLFAVDHFEVNTESALAQVLALARNFSDMTMPNQPMKVGKVSSVPPPKDSPPEPDPCMPPENWDALRGAAAMAAYAVPAIDPWIDLFCHVLSDDGDAAEQAESLHAPWWKIAPWNHRISGREDLPALWRAIMVELSQRGRLREWHTNEILDSICKTAISFGEDEERIRRLRSETTDLLNDRATVEGVMPLGDQLSLTLQLLLLRPSPEKFHKWREDWVAVPPAVWWTGMMLTGYVQGYRSLPKQFRGTSESQKILALKIWQLASKTGCGPWNELVAKRVIWTGSEDTIILNADGVPFAEHKLRTRGYWFRADLVESSIQEEARNIASQACPEAIISMITLTDVSLPLGGSGSANVPANLRRLDIQGSVELPINEGVTISTRLDAARFRDWIATASITQRIRRPLATKNEPSWKSTKANASELPPHLPGQLPLDSGIVPKKVKKLTTQRKESTQAVAPPTGLKVLENFISPEEEEILFTTIESHDWDSSMKRRVQHFGWRYDYKARKVDSKSYLGPLPGWAQSLAERLIELNVVSELPDQVIVNNYDGNQGIAKHIDCPQCFRGPVVTISLLESWDMIFTRKKKDGVSERFVQPLPRRSAVILADEARSSWYHEIPGRVLEHGARRIRRISITFRKVAPTTLNGTIAKLDHN